MKNRFVNLIFYPCFLFSFIGCSVNEEVSIRKEYYDSGILKSVVSYKKDSLNGISREYYEEGTLKHAINYDHNVLNGMYNTYYPNGSIWIKEVYDQGALIGRNEYNEKGEVVKKENFGNN